MSKCSGNIQLVQLPLKLNGLNLGISAPFIGSLWAELFGLESLGTVKALFHAIGVLASALSPVVFGYIIDWGFGIGDWGFGIRDSESRIPNPESRIPNSESRILKPLSRTQKPESRILKPEP